MAKHGRARGGVAFLITFLLFLALFGGVGIWGLSEYLQHTNPASDQNTATPTTVTPSTSEAYHLLLITEHESKAQGFVVLSAKPTDAHIRVMPLPPETAVSVNMTAVFPFRHSYRAE